MGTPEDRPKAEGVRHETSRLSFHQFAYIFLINGIGSAILNGGVNFGLATVMYKNTPIPITTWALPNTLAGDSIVTIMIQVTLTWIISGMLTRWDVKGDRIQPLSWKAPQLLWCIRFILFEGDFDFLSSGATSRLFRLFATAVRGVVFAGASAALFWPLSIIYPLVAFGNRGIVPNWPTPQIYKAVLGAVVGLFTTPPVAILGLMEGFRFLHSRKPTEVIPVVNSNTELVTSDSLASMDWEETQPGFSKSTVVRINTT